MKHLFTVVMMITTITVALSQKFTETVTKSFVAAKVLYVANVNGSINVESYQGSTIEISVRKQFRAKTNKDLEEMKQNITLALMEKTDTMIIYIRGIGDCFCQRKGNRWNSARYQYHFQDWDTDYEYSFDFNIKVPSSINLVLSTINDGDITVSETTGSIDVRNINGGLTLNGISGQTTATTINGDVDINYKKVPDSDSRFYTLNGDINANFNEVLNAELGFKSYNGDLYTNINDLEYLPVKIEKTESNGENGIKYKIGEYTAIKVRNGGVKLDFETFNGDVIIKEILN